MQRKKHLQLGLATAVLLAGMVALLAGCGGGDGAETSSAAPLTKKEFLKQGNALCNIVLAERDERVAQAYEEHIAEYKRLPKAGQEDLVAGVASEIDLPLYKKLVRKLGELVPPAKDEKTISQILSRYEALLGQLLENPEKLAEAEPLGPNAEAVSYGLISCGL